MVNCAWIGPISGPAKVAATNQITCLCPSKFWLWQCPALSCGCVKVALLSLLLACSCSFAAEVLLGNEVLAKEGFKAVQGKRVGLITNPSGVNRKVESTVEVLRRAPGVKLAALFGPEHGIYGDVFAGETVENQTDNRTGLPAYSLYGTTRRPTAEMLKALDALVYDLQDTGCRSYTFISTMGVAMDAAG